MADGITLDKVNVEIESNSSKAASSIDKLTESIKKLQSATTGGIGELSKLNTTIKGIVDNINNSFNNVGNVNTENIKRNISNTINKIDKSFTGISSKALKNKFNIKPEFDFDSIKEDTSILSEYGEKTKIISKNGEVVSVTLKKVENGIQTVTNVSKKGIVQTEKYTNEQSKLYKVLSAFGKIGFLSIAKRVFAGVGKYTDMSAQYINNMNYFNTTMGTMKNTAKDFVNTMERDFHLDPSNVMNYMASFNSLIKGFGIADEQAYKMSKNLTQLSYDLAAFKGLSIEDAMQKIKSGISGELEPMRAIGVALDQATLQETAYKLGIEKRVSTMTRAQKTELLYYQMMQSTSQAQNYFANTLAKTTGELKGSEKLILNPATALSILKQQFSQLGRAIGNIFIPILTKMIPYIMAATQVLRDLANAIAAAFGFKLEDYDFSSSAGNVSAGIDGIGDSADKTAKKVKGMLAPFDELNAIDFGNNTGGDSSVGGGGSLGLDLQDYDWLKNDALNERVQEIKKKFEDLLPIIEAIGAAILTWKVGKSVLNFLDQIIDIDKKGSMKQLLGLTLMISGLTLMYGGLKKVMEGDISPTSILEVVFGGVATYIGASFLFKVPVSASITLLLALNITLLTSIIGWWNKYYDETKQELYNNKKDLNLGEFLNVSFTAVGKGVSGVLDSLFGENFTKGISNYFKQNKTAKAILGGLLNALTFGLMDSQIKKGLNENGENAGSEVIAGITTFIFNPALGIINVMKVLVEKIGEGLSKAAEAFGTWFENDVKPWFTKEKWTEIAIQAILGIFEKYQEWQEKAKYVEEWFNTKVKPWFTKEVWDEIIKIAVEELQMKFNSWKEKFKPLEEWYTNKVKPWFTKEKWSEIISNAISELKTKFDNWKNSSDPIGNWWRDNVSPWFTKKKWQDLGETALKGLKSTLKLEEIKFKMPHLSWTSTTVTGWKADVLSALGLPTSLPKLNVSWYADGGFPEVGELFIANENGPEWISTMGGKSAVANQDQMTTGIRQAAYEGVSQALRENPQSHKTEVNIGNRKVYEGYGSYQTRQANKYGVSTVTV